MSYHWQKDLPINVQHSNKRMLFYSSVKGFVHMIYNPVKEISIDMFGKCISGIDGMKFRNRLDVGFGGSCELPMAKPVGHLFILHTHEVTEDGEGFMLGLTKNNRLGLEAVSPITHTQLCNQNCLQWSNNKQQQHQVFCPLTTFTSLQ